MKSTKHWHPPAPSPTPSSDGEISHASELSHTREHQKYTVIVRGETFVLSHAQITYDAPNYFTASFLSGFTESTSRTISVDRNPTLFSLIVDYLTGYDILPLDGQSLPPMMGKQVALKNLLKDAEYYGLERLCDMISNASSFSWTGFHPSILELERILDSDLPEGIARLSDGAPISAAKRLPVVVRATALEFR